MGVFDGYSIATTAMRAFRQGMNVAGYNVANASTAGYSRRRLELSTMASVPTIGGYAGMGVEVSSLGRIRDPFLDFAVRRESGRLGYDVAREDVLSALEPSIGEIDSERINTSLSGFFSAVSNLQSSPSDGSVRQSVLLEAEQLANAFRTTDEILVEARRNADDKAASTVDRINTILEELSGLNLEVTSLEAGGGEASDLRDQRDLLVDELSTLVPVRVIENDLGQVSVYIEGTGDTLLTKTTVHPLELSLDSEGFRQVLVSRAGERVDLTDAIRGSQLGGYLEVRDELLVSYREKLDDLASAVISEVNAVHTAGYDLNGDAGIALFVPDPPGSNPAAAIQLNPLLDGNPSMIAASSQPGEEGNAHNLEALLGLQTKSIGGLGNLTFAGFGADLVADLGHDVKSSQTALKSSVTIVDSLETKRASISGVSLDEEAAELARWQQSFQAAAKFLQTINSMTQLTLEMF